MTEVQSWLREFPQVDVTTELHITEWGHDSENHGGYDTNYGAAHTAAAAIEMVGVVERAFVFEIQDGKDPAGKHLWGRWGLLSHNDAGAVKKPRYNALIMLDSIGDQRLQILGKGTWVKALAARNDDGNTEVVVSNFDRNGRNSENVPVTITNIVPGEYLVTKEFLDGRRQSERIATTEAALRADMLMTPNMVGKITFDLQYTSFFLPEQIILF